MDNQRIIKQDSWTRYINIFTADKNKKVKSVTFDLTANDFIGNLNITDLQLQSGKQVTVQVPNTEEFLIEKKFNVDEQTFFNTVTHPVKLGPAQAQIYNPMNTRMFNINGRGHETLAIANVFHEDYSQELVTTGLNLTLYAKNDFDALRISTNVGTVIDKRIYDDSIFQAYYENNDYHHPLNYQYSREFYFGSGKVGDEITLSCNDMTAFVDSTAYQYGTRSGVAGARQRIPMAPWGSFRLRVEFYKSVTENLKAKSTDPDLWVTYLKDVGIGFYGNAQFIQVQSPKDRTF